ncbi:DUF6585 family protein [Catellatospora vulcania]|uniref:DUF6585 family protein n=1 Tax=Catellatospora vulcania TaxID=1460450 RepID=UPI0012D436B4|nr:DUF6585 family protein [Catellatospora vulcania]
MTTYLGSDSVPMEAAVAAGSRALGPHQVSYPVQTAGRPLVGLGIFVVLWTAVAGLMAVSAGDSPGLYGSSPWEAALPFTVLAAVSAAGFLLLLARSPIVSARARQLQVHVFEHGWVRVRRRRVEVYRWDEVLTLYAAVGTSKAGHLRHPVHHYRITFADGRHVSLRNYSTDMVRFGPLLVDAVTRVQLPRAAAHLRADGTVAFGAFIVTGGGVATRKGGFLAWPEFGGVSVESDQVSIFDRQGRRASPQAAVDEIPNVRTFLLLVHALAKNPA